MSSLEAVIIARAKNRIPPHQIARDLRVTRDKVYSTIRRARSNGEEIPFFSTGRPHQRPDPATSERYVLLPPRLLPMLTSYSDERGLTVNEAACFLLENAIFNT